MKNHPGEALILHGVTITHPDRVVYKDGRITKGDVARYYAAVAPLLLRGRNISSKSATMPTTITSVVGAMMSQSILGGSGNPFGVM